MSPYLLVTDKATLVRLSINDQGSAHVADLSTRNMSSLVALDVDARDETMYWSDSDSDKIFSANVDGSDMREVSYTPEVILLF